MDAVFMLTMVGLSLLQIAAPGCDGVTRQDGPGASGVTGQVLAKSDVQTMPDAPLQAGVLAIAVPHVDSLRAHLGLAAAAEDPSRLGVLLPASLFEEYVAAHTRTAPDGRFRLDVAPGDYWLCLADVGGEAVPGVPPAYVNGCIRISIGAGEALQQDVYWGEAGVTAD